MLIVKAIQIQEFAVYTRYLNSNKGHYGLNMKYYTHFTSPLRRFADVIVHEQLNSCLFKQKIPKYERRLEIEIDIINKARSRNKKLKQIVSESFLNLFLYLKQKTLNAQAIVMSLGLQTISLFIPMYNIIKEVDWTVPVEYIDKDGVKLSLGKSSRKIYKNDTIGIMIESSMDQ